MTTRAADGFADDHLRDDSSGADLLGDHLVEAPADDDATLAALHDRLSAAALSTGAVDVAYTTVDSPVGTLLLASTPEGLVRVAYVPDGLEVELQQLADRVSVRVLRAPQRLDDAARQLEEYFAGRRTAFDLPLDLRLATGFRRTVLMHLTQIGYGRTQSYAALAASAGSPRAVRAAGTACALNPLPVVVPCHRVIRSDGSVGSYIGGSQAKRALLALESAV